MGLIDNYKSLIETEKEVERLKLIGANSELPERVADLRSMREKIAAYGDARLQSELGYLAWMVDRRISEANGLPEAELIAWKEVQRKYRSRTEKGLTAIDPIE